MVEKGIKSRQNKNAKLESYAAVPGKENDNVLNNYSFTWLSHGAVKNVFVWPFIFAQD